MFDVFTKGFNFVNIAHFIYRKIQRYAFFKRYEREEILTRLAELGVKKVEWKYENGLYYIQQN